MKIDELAEKLNELESLRIEKRSDGMIIYSKDNTDYDFFFSLGYKNKSLTDVGFDWSCLDDVKPADLYKALIQPWLIKQVVCIYANCGLKSTRIFGSQATNFS